MTDATVNGTHCTRFTLTVRNKGPWFAECDFDSDPALSGLVTIKVGALELRGTVDEAAGGVFGAQRRTRIVAGAGAWGRVLESKSYHNDARVKARNVAEDAARAVGETIGTFVPAAERVGVDYVRQAGPASRALEDVIGGVAWWVDADGITHVGPRPAAEVDADAYEVLAYDPRARVLTLAVDDPAVVGIGAMLTKGLDGPQTVRELEATVDAGDLRIVAWCGASEAGEGSIPGLLRAIVDRATDGRLHGKFRYRVVRMSGDRVECQAVRAAAGLPDVLPVSMWPGVAGAHAELTPGAEVLVEFIEGDRSMPIITHFSGKDGTGHVPVEIVLCGSAQRVARQGDLVQSGGVGTVCILTPLAPGPPPPAVTVGVPHLISFSSDPAAVGPLAAPLYGAISTGSPKVKA